jgi:hypothetical protein
MGGGTFGKVFRCVRRDDDEVVAVKKIDIEGMDDETIAGVQGEGEKM